MKNKIKNKLYSNRYIIAAFFCSALIMSVIYAIKHIYPFGDQTLLKVDLYHQYAPYLEELRSRILNGRSLLYSWEGGLGKNFFAQMAYYTASPLSFLMLLFPQTLLPEALALLILLKTSLCSSVFAFYAKSHFRKSDCSILLVGLLYGFCAFMTCFYWNVMWLDTVCLFPLVALGVEKLIHENRSALYYFSLTLTMIVNFYLAVLVCILICGYFIVILFTGFQWKSSKKIIVSKTVKFGFISVLCALSSMFILCPVALALNQTATSSTAFPSFEIYSNIYQLLTDHFIGAKASVLSRNEDLPNIYCGVFTMVLLPVYYFNKDIKRREKWLMSSLLIFMLLCSCIRPLDFIIHGFHFPSNLPHRFTFIYSFILLNMAYQGFLHIRSCRFRYVIFAGIFYIAGICFTEFVLAGHIPDVARVLSDSDILLNVCLIILYVCIIYEIFVHSVFPRLCAIILLVCVIGECLFSASQNIDDTCSRDSYVKYMTDTDQTLDYLEQQEKGSFYRTEFSRYMAINDASIYHYNGFSQFSSLAPAGICDLMKSLGTPATGNSYRYYDPTPLIDAIFGIKYVMNKDHRITHDNWYRYISNFGSIWLYENDRCLPLGFMTDSEISDWTTTYSQPFAVQNDFIKKAAGMKENMFHLLSFDHMSQSYMSITPLSDPGCFNYTLTDSAALSLEPTVTAEITSDKDQYLYLYVNAPNCRQFHFKTDNANERRDISTGRSLINVGYVSAGEKVQIDFTLTKKGAFEKGYRKTGTVRLYAAGYDDTVFQKAYDKLSENVYHITSFEDTHIEGTVNSDKEGILFTSIPYIDGWEITVDGKEADRISIGNDGLIGVKISPGNHKVVFNYAPKELIPCAVISFFGITMYILYWFLEKRKNKITTGGK